MPTMNLFKRLNFRLVIIGSFPRCISQVNGRFIRSYVLVIHFQNHRLNHTLSGIQWYASKRNRKEWGRELWWAGRGYTKKGHQGGFNQFLTAMYLGCYFDSIITGGEISCLRNRHGAGVSLPRSDRHPGVERGLTGSWVCVGKTSGSGKHCTFSCSNTQTGAPPFYQPQILTSLGLLLAPHWLEWCKAVRVLIRHGNHEIIHHEVKQSKKEQEDRACEWERLCVCIRMTQARCIVISIKNFSLVHFKLLTLCTIMPSRCFSSYHVPEQFLYPG